MTSFTLTSRKALKGRVCDLKKGMVLRKVYGASEKGHGAVRCYVVLQYLIKILRLYGFSTPSTDKAMLLVCWVNIWRENDHLDTILLCRGRGTSKL